MVESMMSVYKSSLAAEFGIDEEDVTVKYTDNALIMTIAAKDFARLAEQFDLDPSRTACRDIVEAMFSEMTCQQRG